MYVHVYIICIYFFVYIHIYRIKGSLESLCLSLDRETILDDHPPQSASAQCFFPLGGFSRLPLLHAWSGGFRWFFSLRL